MAGKRPTKRTAKKGKPETRRQRFLRLLAELGTVTAAAAGAGISRDTAYRWKAEEPEFAAAWADAEEQAADDMEAEARRRAMAGVNEPVYQGGKKVGAVRRFSDTLLIFLLKGARPEKFRERVSAEHSGPGGGPIPVAATVDLKALSDEELAQLEGLLTLASRPVVDEPKPE